MVRLLSCNCNGRVQEFVLAAESVKTCRLGQEQNIDIWNRESCDAVGEGVQR